MTRFAALFAAIDHTTSTSDKVEAMAGYFAEAPAADAAWAVFFLTGRRLKRLISNRAIGGWITAATGLPEWLLGECYAVVGDGAETAALLFDDQLAAPGPRRSLAEWVEGSIQGLRQVAPEAQAAQVLAWLGELPRWERFTLLKLLTGELRVGVSQTLVVRALAQSRRVAHTGGGGAADGRVDAVGGMVHRARRRRRHHRRSDPPVSVLPGGAARSRGAQRRRRRRPARRSARLADRVEVGRHPGPADSA